MSNETKIEIESAPALPTVEAPMIIPRIQRQTDGSFEVMLALSKDQTYTLINFAVMFLTAQGLATVVDQVEKAATEGATESTTAPETQEFEVGEQIH